MLHGVILAGGAGTRLWPASRAGRPKQLLPLAGGRSLLEATWRRLEGLVPEERRWIVARAPLLEAARRAVPAIGRGRLLEEPMARGTAAATVFAASRIALEDPEACMLVCPADHFVAREDAFRSAAAAAARAAEGTGALVAFGIRPTGPATGLGWMEAGEALEGPWEGAVVRHVVSFREKPGPRVARRLLETGRHFWNGGIFAWKAAAFLEEVGRRARRLARAAEAMGRAGEDRAALEEAFRAAPATSVDYALLEKTDRLLMVEADMGWADVGSFAALAAVAPLDAAGNAGLGLSGAQVVFHASSGCAFYGEGAGLTVVLGAKEMVVVRCGDVTLVCPRERAEGVRAVVEELGRQGRKELL